MKKYKQTVIPEVSTKEWRGLTLFNVRKKMFDFYKKHYTGLKVINKDIGITVEFERAGNKKTSYGGFLYPKKACLVEVLDKLIRYAEYSNWGDKKEKDEPYVIGYLNFKIKVRIDGIIEYAHLVIRVRNTGKFQYSIDLNHWKK